MKTIPRGRINNPLLTEIRYLAQGCFRRLDNDEITFRFEKVFANYMGSQNCVAFPLARVAIYTVLKNQNFPPGSEILMPPITIKGILDVVLSLNLKPVFVDLDPNSFCFDFQKLKEATTSKTKAALITYLFGLTPNVEDMITYLKNLDIFVIEDFSQCLNGKVKDKKIGTFSDVGIYSASSIKTLDTFGGGLAITDNKKIYSSLKQEQARLGKPSRIELLSKIMRNIIRNFLTNPLVFGILTFRILKIMDRLKPGSTLKQTGERSLKPLKHLPHSWFRKYTSVQAKAGLEFITFVKSRDKSRIRNVDFVKTHLHHLKFPTIPEHVKPVYWQFAIVVDSPLLVQKTFFSKNIDVAGTSLSLISEIPKYKVQQNTPQARRIYNNTLFIPSFPGLEQGDLHRIVNTLKDIHII